MKTVFILRATESGS